jgi:3-oxoacyl-[acyl-carrier protein] reductase
MRKTALITGTSRGIGKTIVNVFAENGWNVVAHARKRTEEFENYLSELAALNNVSITPIYFDMLDSAGIKENIKELKKDNIIVDALVNNAGITYGGLFQMTPVSAIKDVFNVNLFAHMELTQFVLKIMAKKGASIVNVASVAGVDFRAGNSAYGVSKAAMVAWTKVLSVELRDKVRVNAVAPGLTETDMAREAEEKLQAITLSRAVISRLAKPEEIAKTIYFLSSDDASFITGQVLKVDGGGGI